MKRLLILLFLVQATLPAKVQANDNGTLLTGIGAVFAGLGVVALTAGTYQYLNSDGCLVGDAGILLSACKSEYGYLRLYTTMPVADDNTALHNLYADIKTHHGDVDTLYRGLHGDLDRIERTYRYLCDRYDQRVDEYAQHDVIHRLAVMRDAIREQRTYLNNLYLVIKGQRAFLLIVPDAHAVIDTWEGFSRWYGSAYGASESALHSYVLNVSKHMYPYLDTVDCLNGIIDRFERAYTSNSLYNYAFIRQASIALSNLKDLKRAIAGSYGYQDEVQRKREDQRREREARAAEDRAKLAKREADAAQAQAYAARQQAEAAQEQARLARAQAYQPAPNPVLEVNVNIRG